MEKYYINEATLELSDGWKDRSVNSFVYSSSDEPELAIVISRIAIDQNEDLRRFVSSQIQILSSELDDIRILSVSDEVLDNIPSVRVKFDWVSDGRRLSQHQIYFFYNKIALVICITSRNSVDDYDLVTKSFLSSFNFRRSKYA